MPCTPNACSAALTSSSVKGLMTAVMSLMRPPSRSPHPTMPYARFLRPVRMCPDRETADRTITAEFPDVTKRQVSAQAGALLWGSAENGVDERSRVERRQVVGTLAKTDQL